MDLPTGRRQERSLGGKMLGWMGTGVQALGGGIAAAGDLVGASPEQTAAENENKRFTYALQHNYFRPGSETAKMALQGAQVENAAERADVLRQKADSIGEARLRQTLLNNVKYYQDLYSAGKLGSGPDASARFRSKIQPMLDELRTRFNTDMDFIENATTDANRTRVIKYDDAIIDAINTYNKIADPNLSDGSVRQLGISIMKKVTDDKGNISESEATRYIMANLRPEDQKQLQNGIQQYLQEMSQLANKYGQNQYSRQYMSTKNDILNDWNKGNRADASAKTLNTLLNRDPLNYLPVQGQVEFSALQEKYKAWMGSIMVNSPVNRQALQNIVKYDIEEAKAKRDNAANQLRVETPFDITMFPMQTFEGGETPSGTFIPRFPSNTPSGPIQRDTLTSKVVKDRKTGQQMRIYSINGRDWFTTEEEARNATNKSK
jgi:hypothetical protein